METASTYFTRRARQERTNAADAASAEARTAHLELALRLVRLATGSAFCSGWSDGAAAGAPAYRQNSNLVEGLGTALGDAFPLSATGPFEQLLNAMDETSARSR